MNKAVVQGTLNATNALVQGVVGVVAPVNNLILNTTSTILGGVITGINNTISTVTQNPNLVQGLLDTASSVQKVTTSLGNVQQLVLNIANATVGDLSVTISLAAAPQLLDALKNVTAGARTIVGNLTNVVGFVNQTFNLVQDNINQAGANMSSSMSANATNACQVAAHAATNNMVNKTTSNARMCFQNEIDLAQSNVVSVNQILSNLVSYTATGQIKLSDILYAITTITKMSTDIAGVETRLASCATVAVAQQIFDSVDVMANLAVSCATNQ